YLSKNNNGQPSPEQGAGCPGQAAPGPGRMPPAGCARRGPSPRAAGCVHPFDSGHEAEVQFPCPLKGDGLRPVSAGGLSMFFSNLRKQMRWILIVLVAMFGGSLLYVGGPGFFGGGSPEQ